MYKLSVATMTLSNSFAKHVCSYTRCIIVFPLILTKGFPGKRKEPNRAGIMPKIFKKT